MAVITCVSWSLSKLNLPELLPALESNFTGERVFRNKASYLKYPYLKVLYVWSG